MTEPVELQFDGIDIPITMRETTNLEKQLVSVVYGRLLDKYWYAPDYGVNLPKLLLRSDIRDYPKFASICEQELLKDTRIVSATVNISNPINNSVTVTINITPYNSVNQIFVELGSFQTI